MKYEAMLRSLKGDVDQIDRHIRGNLSSRVPLINEVGNYIILAGGKRLRSLLFVLSARLCGYLGQLSHYYSTIFEYLHSATLLHDDVVDGADIRRGKAAANIEYGNQAAVLVGDFLLSKSFSQAVEIGDIRMLEVLSNTTTMMAEGEVLELVHILNLAITQEEYLQVIISKTAILFSASCHMGAIFGRADNARQQALKSYGLNLGIAFQVVDDNLDYTSNVAEFGKPVGNDLKEGKITLPLIIAMKDGTTEDKTELASLIKKRDLTETEFTRIRDLVNKTDALPKAHQIAWSYIEKAKSDLDVFPDSPEKTLFLNLASYVVERKK
ncbi:MAG: polyprenyl synthetase family protein [Deltaproteobacteria bacterium]|nr:polyprenyl synthetase family protein [Deltaproteobacteria bacterium]